MTRKGIHTQISIEFAAKREVNPHDITDAIYDDFESRTCESCIYDEFGMYCSEKIKRPSNKKIIYSEEPDKDFGCNKFVNGGNIKEKI